MPSSLIAPVVGAGASFLGSKLFGPKQQSAAQLAAPVMNAKPIGINAGGFGTSFANDTLTVTPSADRLAQVAGLRNVFGEQSGAIGNQITEFGAQRAPFAADLAALRRMVAPGVSELRSNRLAEIESARERAIGNLRENLARRRVLGSSFGQDTISRAEAEFAGERDRASAESTMQELEASNRLLEQGSRTQLQEFEATNQLINQQFEANRKQFQTGIDELNLEASLAASIGAKATEVMSANARFLSEFNAKEQAGAGKFFGQTMQPIASAIGTGASRLFGGGVTAPSTAGGGFFGGSPSSNPNLIPIG